MYLPKVLERSADHGVNRIEERDAALIGRLRIKTAQTKRLRICTGVLVIVLDATIRGNEHIA
jgi:hypothetical protein